MVILLKLQCNMMPVQAVTSCAKTISRMLVLTVTGHKKSMLGQLSFIPSLRLFGSPIALLLLWTNKPMRMDFVRDIFNTLVVLEL